MKPDDDNLDRKWFVRAIGVFCGAFIGLATAAFCISLVGALTTFQSAVAISIGSITGMVLGYFFPGLTEFILRSVPNVFR